MLEENETTPKPEAIAGVKTCEFNIEEKTRKLFKQGSPFIFNYDIILILMCNA